MSAHHASDHHGALQALAALLLAGATFAFALALLLGLAPARAGEGPASTIPGSRPSATRPQATPHVAAPAVPLTAQERTLLEIEAAGQRQVEVLSKTLGAMPPGRERQALAERIVQAKQETRISILRARAGFALQRGDLVAAREIALAIEGILHPQALSSPPAAGAAQPRPQVKEGGRP